MLVFGMTWSDEFPDTPGALQSTEVGINDCFVTRLSADGSKLVWSTRIGSSDAEIAGPMACTPQNEVVFALQPWADDVPNLPASGFDTQWNQDDTLVVRLAADGAHVLAATYLKAFRILDLAVDSSGHVYVAGNAATGGSPVTPTAHQTAPPGPGGSGGGYAAKFSSDLSELVYGTHIGGNDGGTTVWGIAVDAAGALYVATQCGAENSPTSLGAFQPAVLDGGPGYIARLLPMGTELAWGSYLGEWTLNGGGYPETVVVDAAGNATISGWANTPGWPTTPDAFQAAYVGPFPSADGATSQVDAVGESLVYSSWFGLTGSELVRDSAIGASGQVALALTAGAGLPTTPGVYDQTPNGSGDCGVAIFDLGLAPWRILGPGTKGSIETPNLVGLGENTPGAPTRLALRGALPFTPTFFVVGDVEVNFPILGGTLVPFPQLVLTRVTNALGWRDLHATWPNLFPGQDLVFQAWCYDPGAPEQFGASNGLKGLTQ